MSQYLDTLTMLDAQGYLVCGHDKAPVYPKKDWQIKARELSARAAFDAYTQWGGVVRGVGVVAYDSLAILDFDPMEKTLHEEPDLYEARKIWRENVAQRLLKGTYAESSRSGRGLHFIFRVDKHYSGTPGVNALRRFYAIDFITGMKYCDITGMRLNDLEPAGGAILDKFLAVVAKAHVDTMPAGAGGYLNGSVPLGALAEIVDHIKVDPEDYNTWIVVGICLWQETLGSNEGLAIWDAWSRKYGSYKYGGKFTPQQKWATFKPSNSSGASLTVGTLIRMAETSGANIAEIRLRHAPVVSEVARTMKWDK